MPISDLRSAILDRAVQILVDMNREVAYRDLHSSLMAAFPNRTEADFYLWVMDHRHYLVSQGKADLVEPGRAAEEFVQQYLAGKTQPPGLIAPDRLPSE